MARVWAFAWVSCVVCWRLARRENELAMGAPETSGSPTNLQQRPPRESLLPFWWHRDNEWERRLWSWRRREFAAACSITGWIESAMEFYGFLTLESCLPASLFKVPPTRPPTLCAISASVSAYLELFKSSWSEWCGLQIWAWRRGLLQKEAL